jgi:DNA-binding NarL/FixJ family response regulator
MRGSLDSTIPSSKVQFLKWRAEVLLKLLIVDDNAAVRRLIRRIVQPLAGQICECADGAEALAVYQSQRPDAVLMDIRLGEVDGIQATARIKASDPDARIVMVTDYDDETLRHAAMRAGACGYVLKDNLLDLVRLLEAMKQSIPGRPGTEFTGD